MLSSHIHPLAEELVRWNDEHAEKKACRSQHIHASPLLTSKGLLNLKKHGPSIRSAPHSSLSHPSVLSESLSTQHFSAILPARWNNSWTLGLSRLLSLLQSADRNQYTGAPAQTLIAAVISHANRSPCCGVFTSSAGISQTLQQKANRRCSQCCVSLVLSPFLSAWLHGEHECDDALFAVLLHLAAFQRYSWERHHAVLTWTDFILL